MTHLPLQLLLWFGEAGAALLRLAPPETAHRLAVWLLNSPVFARLPKPLGRAVNAESVSLQVNLPGLGILRHPIGLAAGFDKNATCARPLVELGFSFLELGTVTPRPQPGNPSPRIFRLSSERGIVNRLGFNSDGADAVAARLKLERWRQESTPLGINLGKNRMTPHDEAAADYRKAFDSLKSFGKYFVINISSPNTPNLRELATPEFIGQLGEVFSDELYRIWIKLDPDMEKRQFQALVGAIASVGFQGLILTNTHRVQWPHVGGQSGHSLLLPSTTCLEWAWAVHNGRLPTIGVGGIMSGVDVFHKIARGATAVQIYTALIYRGPWVVMMMLRELAEEMQLRGFQSLEQVYGSYYD